MHDLDDPEFRFQVLAAEEDINRLPVFWKKNFLKPKYRPQPKPQTNQNGKSKHKSRK